MHRLLGLLLVIGMALPGKAADDLSDAQKKAVRGEIAQFLKDEPQAVVDALKAFQEQEMMKEQQAQADALADIKSDLITDLTPMTGSKTGDVTVIEFLDYNCGYCKRAHSVLKEALKKDNNIKVYYKDFPILGEGSYFSAKAVLAARNQGKYLELHNALLESKGRLNKDSVLKLAKDIDLDIPKLEKDMESADITAELAANVSQAEKLQIRGTPAFIVNDEVFPGAFPSADAFLAKINAVRKAQK